MGQKTVVLLVGPKGSGKTHLGTRLEEHSVLRFLRIEPVFIRIYAAGGTNEGGYDAVFDVIERELQVVDCVSCETLGAAPEFTPLLGRLRERYTVRLVRLRAPLDVCARRVRTRSAEDHIPVSDHQLDEINAIANGVEMDWDLELDSSGTVDTRQLVSQIESMLNCPEVVP